MSRLRPAGKSRFTLEKALSRVQVRVMRPSVSPQVPLFNLVERAAIALGSVWICSQPVLAQECPLSAPLVLKDTQDGYFGQSGTVWKIAPDCDFTVAQQIGRKISEPLKRGRLTSKQRIQL